MDLQISQYPGSFLVAQMHPSEQIITEKGAMIFCNGEHEQQNKIEMGSVKNWIAKMTGKSFTYNIYTAKEKLKFVFAPKQNAELFLLDIKANNPLLFEPKLHFARTMGLEIQLAKQSWKSTLNDGLKLRTQGTDTLILQGYGNIIEQEINSMKPIYVDEDALIAFEEKLTIKTISKGMKAMFTSGEGLIFEIKGQGKIWLQTREEGASSGGGFISSAADIFS